jgi:hypothetical protein
MVFENPIDKNDNIKLFKYFIIIILEIENSSFVLGQTYKIHELVYSLPIFL